MRTVKEERREIDRIISEGSDYEVVQTEFINGMVADFKIILVTKDYDEAKNVCDGKKNCRVFEKFVLYDNDSWSTYTYNYQLITKRVY